jgi:hypothetical protein
MTPAPPAAGASSPETSFLDELLGQSDSDPSATDDVSQLLAAQEVAGSAVNELYGGTAPSMPAINPANAPALSAYLNAGLDPSEPSIDVLAA